ncbi:MAG: helix-turn-helix transcriptional regulator [Merdibacter sp.]
MTLQQIIQRYRQNSGLSYEAIARQLDVSRSTVCRWATARSARSNQRPSSAFPR